MAHNDLVEEALTTPANDPLANMGNMEGDIFDDDFEPPAPSAYPLGTNDGRCGFLEAYIWRGEDALWESVNHIWHQLAEPKALRCTMIGLAAGKGGSVQRNLFSAVVDVARVFSGGRESGWLNANLPPGSDIFLCNVAHVFPGRRRGVRFLDDLENVRSDGSRPGIGRHSPTMILNRAHLKADLDRLLRRAGLLKGGILSALIARMCDAAPRRLVQQRIYGPQICLRRQPLFVVATLLLGIALVRFPQEVSTSLGEPDRFENLRRWLPPTITLPLPRLQKTSPPDDQCNRPAGREFRSLRSIAAFGCRRRRRRGRRRRARVRCQDHRTVRARLRRRRRRRRRRWRRRRWRRRRSRAEVVRRAQQEAVRSPFAAVFKRGHSARANRWRKRVADRRSGKGERLRSPNSIRHGSSGTSGRYRSLG